MHEYCLKKDHNANRKNPQNLKITLLKLVTILNCQSFQIAADMTEV